MKQTNCIQCLVFVIAMTAACNDDTNGSGGSGATGATSSNGSGQTGQASTSASGTSSSSSSGSGTGSSTGSSASTGSTMAEMLNDSQIAQVASTANTGEIQEAQAVMPRLTNANVKAFANRMITDHSASNQMLTQLMASESLSRQASNLSKMLMTETQNDIQQLSDAPNTEVDFEYIDMQVKDHQAVLDIIDQVLLPNAQNAALKQFLITTRATVSEHLSLSLQIRNQLNQ